MKFWALFLSNKEFLTEFKHCHDTLDLHFRVILSREE